MICPEGHGEPWKCFKLGNDVMRFIFSLGSAIPGLVFDYISDKRIRHGESWLLFHLLPRQEKNTHFEDFGGT